MCWIHVFIYFYFVSKCFLVFDLCFSVAVTKASLFKFYLCFPFYAAIRLLHARKFSCHFYCLFFLLFSFNNLVRQWLYCLTSDLCLFSFVSFGRFQISTLATKLGVRNIAFLGSGLLLINYIGAVLAAIYVPQVNACNLHRSWYLHCSFATYTYFL